MTSHKRNLKYWMWFFLILGVLGVIELTTEQMVAESVMETYGREAAQLGLGLITGALLFDFELNAGLVTAVKIILDLSLIYFVFAALLYRNIKRVNIDTDKSDQTETSSSFFAALKPWRKMIVIAIVAIYIAILISG